MLSGHFIALLCGGVLFAAPVPVKAGEGFSLTPFGEGFVLLDRKSGAVSQCRKRGEEFVCNLANDDRKRLEDRIAVLESALASLKERQEIDALTVTRSINQSQDTVLSEGQEALHLGETFVTGIADKTANQTAQTALPAPKVPDILLVTRLRARVYLDDVMVLGDEALARLFILADEIKARFLATG